MERDGYHISSIDGKYEIDPDDGTCAFCLKHTSIAHVRDTNHQSFSVTGNPVIIEHTFQICAICLELVKCLILDGNEA